jgi:hypothetical protein
MPRPSEIQFWSGETSFTHQDSPLLLLAVHVIFGWIEKCYNSVCRLENVVSSKRLENSSMVSGFEEDNSNELERRQQSKQMMKAVSVSPKQRGLDYLAR